MWTPSNFQLLGIYYDFLLPGSLTTAYFYLVFSCFIHQDESIFTVLMILVVAFLSTMCSICLSGCVFIISFVVIIMWDKQCQISWLGVVNCIHQIHFARLLLFGCKIIWSWKAELVHGPSTLLSPSLLFSSQVITNLSPKGWTLIP